MDVRDFLGRPIHKGDCVVFIEHSSTSSNLKSGAVIKINPKTVEIEGERGHKVRKEGYKVIVQSAADVAPVVHGEWVDNGIPESILSGCSVCGYTCGAYKFNYCPNCGAKMDSESEKPEYTDYGNVKISEFGEYKLNTAYTEIQRLHEMLVTDGIPHRFQRLYDGWQVVYPDADIWAISAVQHYGSYGAIDNLIEIMGGITPEEGRCNGVLGHLTAENVFKQIMKNHKKRTDTADRCVCCGDAIPEGRQVCPACEGGVT